MDSENQEKQPIDELAEIVQEFTEEIVFAFENKVAQERSVGELWIFAAAVVGIITTIIGSIIGSV